MDQSDTLSEPTTTTGTTAPGTTAPGTTAPGRPARPACDPATSVTKTLLAYGVLAGPSYLLVSLAQALTRDGFDLTRHAWSLLANGALGWIQITNLVLTGVMTGALAVGLHRALRTGTGARWAPRLIGAYGLSLVAAGVFRADPALGFPIGTPETGTAVTWHGTLHFAAGGIGFACLVAACLVLGRRFAAEGRRNWAIASRLTGILFLGGFLAMAGGAGAAWSNLTFTAAIVLSWAWTSAVALHLYRRATPATDN
ncbi:DUF998 domain-containing protein [Plantactinospora endophytica]|uniref:DUF998 domain-containing protein n=1 Tax=Plantactinospora endophytica TaxID=673535 RepID=A0ABQ4E9V6_9ACTN|nr:DUF998 domain-containing protein [Plantactinospora endophytica]GIG91052.1 hypothetical protein Pen02_59880 [Plantactinospora endophytica]